MRQSLAILVLLSALAICPMEDWEIEDAAKVLREQHLLVVRDGKQTTDGRKFVRGFDLHLLKRCLYVINPDGKIERYEYKDKVSQ